MDKELLIGELLKRSREHKNMSLEDLAQKTKININVLRSLEANDPNTLPNKTYVRGFVKNCARTIGFSDKDALNALERLYQAHEPQAVTTEIESQPQSPDTPSHKTQESKDAQMDFEEVQDKLAAILKPIFNRKNFLVALGLIVAVLSIIGTYKFFAGLMKEGKRVSQNTANSSQTQAPTDTTIKGPESSLFEMEIAQKIEADESPKVSQEPEQTLSNVEQDSPKSEEKATETELVEAKPSKAKTLPPGKLPYVNFYPVPSKLYELSDSHPQLELLPDSIKSRMTQGKQSVFLSATKEDTWLSYQTDQDEVKRFILKKGRTFLMQADSVVLLFLGNLNAVNIYYNKQYVSAESKSGVKSLIFPQELAKDYELPLFPTYQGISYKQDEYKTRMVEKSVN